MKTSASSTSGFENLGPPTTFSSLRQAPTLIHIPYRIYPETTAGMWKTISMIQFYSRREAQWGFHPLKRALSDWGPDFLKWLVPLGLNVQKCLSCTQPPRRSRRVFKAVLGFPRGNHSRQGAPGCSTLPKSRALPKSSTFSASLPNNAAHTTCCPKIRLPRFTAGQNRLFFITAKSRKGNVIFSNISGYTLQKICKHLQHLSKKKKVLVQCCMWKQLTGKDENLLPILKKEIFGYQWITNLS